MPFLSLKIMCPVLRKNLYYILLGLLSAFVAEPGSVKAQGPQFIYRVGFTDKTGSPALGNPAAFLSPRALSRRARFGIAVVDSDRPVSPFYTDTTLQITSGVLHTASRWRNEITVLISDTLGLAALRTKPWVQEVQSVGYYPSGLHLKTTPEPVGPNGPTIPRNLGKSTANAAYYGAAWTQTSVVNGQVLHDAGFTGTGMLIAVIDETFRGADTHPGYAALRGSGRLVDSFNFVLRSSAGLYNGSSHGNNVLSCIAGYEPNTYVGAAPDAAIALYVSENSAGEQLVELDQMIAAMERADSIGADLISASLGYNSFDFPVASGFSFSQLDGKTTSVAQAANLATEKGLLVVVSAGNEGNTSWRRILTPGDADSALTVGSVAANGASSNFSGYGPNAAGRVKPDVCGMGQGAAVYNTSGGHFNGNGTSFSTPQIAGFAACLWQAAPAQKPAEVREAIVRSAHRYNNPDAQQGYGIPNFALALRTLGIPEKTASKSLNLTAAYNSEGSRIFIFNTDTGRAILTLYDLAGQKISGKEIDFFSNQTAEWALDIRPAAGLYLLCCENGKGKQTVKIVVP